MLSLQTDSAQESDKRDGGLTVKRRTIITGKLHISEVAISASRCPRTQAGLHAFGRQEVRLSDRKYRQSGYQDRGEEKQVSKPQQPRAKDNTFGPRAIQMPGTRTVSRCAQCGVVLRMVDPSSKCPQCGFELHSCKQCVYFDPSERNECRQPVPMRVSRKDQKNECSFYAIKTAVERETTTSTGRTPSTGASSVTSAPSTASDARRAFENLFKK